MSSRQKILSAIRQHLVPAVELPNLDQEWIQFEDSRKQFLESLGTVGGEGTVVPDLSAVEAALNTTPEYQSAQKISCFTDQINVPGDRLVDLNQIDDPHTLADLDMAIIKGEFGVAENGAIWVTDVGVKHKASFFIAQHVVILLSAAEIVSHMHEAYPRTGLEHDKLGEKPFFGLFISGPSKTADIEQSLVIGAHGARSLRVFLVEDFPS